MSEIEFIKTKIKSWHHISDLAKSLSDGAWIFRGQSNSNWELKTTFSRYIESQKSLSILDHIPDYVEEKILNNFKSRSQKFTNLIVNNEDKTELLALLQHHGGATRLLDFTYSMMIATYFAVKDMDPSGSSSIFGLNLKLLDNALRKKIDLKYERWNPVDNRDRRNRILVNDFLENPDKFKDLSDGAIIDFRPAFFNERLDIQQGTFLFAFKSVSAFEENICNTYNNSGYTKINYKEIDINDYIKPLNLITTTRQNDGLIKIDIPGELKHIALKDLYFLNIYESRLFPDLDGPQVFEHL